MEKLQSEINNIKSLLNGVLQVLNSMDDKNFYDNLSKAKLGMERMAELKLSLKKTFHYDELKKFDPELVKITKQIQESFDNLCTKKKNQFAELGKEIAALRNKSKLVNYYR
ncbi:MAG: hypothetical protein ACYDA4_01815 [Ignavibacteriaceae bacterium]